MKKGSSPFFTPFCISKEYITLNYLAKLQIKKGVIFLFIQYMKNFKWVIIVSVIVLLILLVVMIFHHRYQPEEREYSGLFVKGGLNSNGYLHQAQEKGYIV